MNSEKSPIIFYQYFATTDLEFFKERLIKRFRETGHDREIEFKVWVCDDDIPEQDGDIYCYDAFVLRFLTENGYIQQLPDIIDTSDVFPWVIDTSKVKNKTFGFPWMLCFDSLIYRKKDYKKKYTDDDLKNNIVIPLGTYYPLYFYMVSALLMEPLPFSKGEDITKRKAFSVIKRLAELTGDPGKAFQLHYQDEEALKQFSSGEKKYITHFPEIVSRFPKDEYGISHLKFTDDPDEIPLYYVDFVSIGKNVREEKLLDCLDLLEIICSESFIFDLCAPGGKPSYMCPPLKSLYPKLAKLGPFYNELYEVVKNPDNCTLRYNGNYYEVLQAIIDQVGGVL